MVQPEFPATQPVWYSEFPVQFQSDRIQVAQTSIKKRKYEMGRPATPCKLGAKRVRSVRCRGGNMPGGPALSRPDLDRLTQGGWPRLTSAWIHVNPAVDS